MDRYIEVAMTPRWEIRTNWGNGVVRIKRYNYYDDLVEDLRELQKSFNVEELVVIDNLAGRVVDNDAGNKIAGD